MVREDKGHLEVEDRGAVLIVRVDGGPHSLFGLDIANQIVRHGAQYTYPATTPSASGREERRSMV